MSTDSMATHERMVEWTVESRKTYADPFNDVEVDVVFSSAEQSWRVPMFWHGGQRWTVRFAPPVPGEYSYRLASTDPENADLNGHEGRVNFVAYSGANELLRRGSLSVSTNKRHFEHADGTPFFWLGDTWWSGLSTRLSLEDFRILTADRKAKGFTLVQIVAGLVTYEDLAPSDPGFTNEGGAVWGDDFKRINPAYFDHADRRIQHLLDSGIVPAIVGAWGIGGLIDQMGVAKMKQHWRYIIARYGAYPVFWILGGEVTDPPDEVAEGYSAAGKRLIARGWTEVAQYVRSVDPYHHPLTVHEIPPPFDYPLRDEALMDFDLFQCGHFGWPSIIVNVGQLNTHYARTSERKPVVQGEIGYEKLGEMHFEDFQRTAFWLSMLNGAAGHTYGANGTWQSYSGDTPLHRMRFSFLSWQEGMSLPGARQIGLGANLLRRYPWWRFEPHPEWVSPRGTTLLEPRSEVSGFDFGYFDRAEACEADDCVTQMDKMYGGREWAARNGTFRRPYAAGIPGEVRFVYVPTTGVYAGAAPTIHALELGVRYNAFFWEPSTGTRLELGTVARAPIGDVIADRQLTRGAMNWESGAASEGGVISTLKGLSERNTAATFAITGEGRAAIILRYRDPSNYVAAIYAPEEKSLYFVERLNGIDGKPLGRTTIAAINAEMTLTAEVRENNGAASITDGRRTYATPIIDLVTTAPGRVGLLRRASADTDLIDQFEVRKSPELVKAASPPRGLYDSDGTHRGDLVGADADAPLGRLPGWGRFGEDKHILLDSYRPERLPSAGDWVLVLETEQTS